MAASTQERAIPRLGWLALAFVGGMACSNQGLHRSGRDGGVPDFAMAPGLCLGLGYRDLVARDVRMMASPGEGALS